MWQLSFKVIQRGGTPGLLQGMTREWGRRFQNLRPGCNLVAASVRSTSFPESEDAHLYNPNVGGPE